jgi:hypothetical protein
MDNLDNPAGRLHNLLLAAKKKETRDSGYHLWATVFDISQNPQKDLPDELLVEVIYRIIEIRKLVQEAENALRNIPGLNLELYLEPYPRIKDVIRIDKLASTNYSTHLVQLTSGDMALLAVGAEAIAQHHHHEPIIEEIELDTLENEINDLYKEVFKSSINDELKSFILDQLILIRRAIHEYRIRGIARLREGLANILGEILLHSDLLKRHNNDEEFKKFSSLINHLISVVSFTADATQVLEGASKYLPLLLAALGHS